MFTDYKFWYIKRDDDGFIVEAAIRFYEGEYQIVETDEGMVEKYVRTKKLAVTSGELIHLKGEEDIKYRVDSNGKEAVVYTDADFGTIKEDEELRTFLNNQIASDKGREVIIEQKLQ